MSERSLRRPSLGITTLAMIALAGCAGQTGPSVGPAPGDEPEAAAPPDVDPLAPTERQAEEAGPGVEPAPEDPAVPDAGEGVVEGPTEEEIDAAIREALGGDPVGWTRAGEVRGAHLPLELNERVEAWIHYFQTVIPERFQLYLERKGLYESMIRRKLREADMPQDLLYLALIESGMNPNAYSRARAVGMWQFISSTGRAYDLEVSFWVDERRDPEKATDAALRYLSDLYGEFGSWYLAAAAYNGGPGRIRRGLRRVGDGGTFWDLADARLLRSETTNYVPKLIAAALIGKDPEGYGFRNLRPGVPSETATVRVPDATSFDVLAEVAGTDEETIRELNPHFPRRATPPGRAVDVIIPVGAAEGFEERYAAVPPDERVTWTYHVVSRGQTLSHIAGAYGVSVSAVRASNGNVDPRRLQIGQRLLIPSPARLASSSRSAGGSQTGSESRPTTIVVRSGDSLWSIGRRYSVSTRELMQWNGLSSSTIHPGDQLRIQPSR